MVDGYEKLASEIILMAVKDYRSALKALKRNSRNKSALFVKADVEKFFKSEWFAQLTELDPEVLIEKLKKEVS